jgi:hypothetical protein
MLNREKSDVLYYHFDYSDECLMVMVLKGIDPWYVPLKSKTKRNLKLEWRQKLREKGMKKEE